MQRQEQSSTPLPSSSRRIAGAGSIDAHSVYAPPHSRFTRRAGDGRVGGWRQRAAAMRGQTIFGGAWWRVTPSDLWFELRHYLSQRASLTRHTAPTYNKQCVCLCGRCGPVANRLSIGRSGGSVHAHTYAYIWWRQGPGCSMVYCTVIPTPVITAITVPSSQLHVICILRPRPPPAPQRFHFDTQHYSLLGLGSRVSRDFGAAGRRRSAVVDPSAPFFAAACFSAICHFSPPAAR